MFANVPLIKDRLAQALAPGWTVVDGTEPQDRGDLPRADVRLNGAAFEAKEGIAVSLRVRYLIGLVVVIDGTRGPFISLDAAVDAVIASLHGWKPDGGPSVLGIEAMAPLEFPAAGQFGYQLGFSMKVVRKGVPYR